MLSKMTEILRNFKFTKFRIVILSALILSALICVAYLSNAPKTISQKDLSALIYQNLVDKIYVDDEFLVIISKNHSYKILRDFARLNEIYGITIDKKSRFGSVVAVLFAIIIFCLAVFMLFKFYFKGRNFLPLKHAQIENIINSSLTPVISNVKFSDVGGIKGVKDELIEIVDFLANPQKYSRFGVSLPRGVLMIGAPGVGKTLIAKAVAGEANVPFFYQSGASFAQIYVGMGAKRVRELFAKAKSYAPSIVFIDEIDAVGKARGGVRNDEREATLNQLLTEMDGFEDNSGVMVIAATNKIDMLDEALLRSGRFDRRIFVPMPDFRDRVEILKIYLKNKQSEVDIENIAKSCVGFSAAALATLVNEAAINALKNGRITIVNDDFEAVVSCVLHGKHKVLTYSKEEKEILSIYQAAKAISAFWLDLRFEKISILQDKFVETECAIKSQKMLLSKIKVALAGMAGLKIYKDEMYSNAKNDLDEAKFLAHKMAYEYAMSQNIVASQNDVEMILNVAFGEISEYLKKIPKQIKEVAEFIYKSEAIEYEKVREIIAKSYD